MGEEPCLWSSLKLKFYVVHGVDEDGDGDWLQLGPLPDPHWASPNAGPVGTVKELKDGLNMARLQTLEQITLDFSPSRVHWSDFMAFLAIIPPTVRKLSLLMLGPILPPEPRPPFQVFAELLAEELIKFEEVNFGRDGFLLYRHRDRDLGLFYKSDAVFRALSAISASGRGSKLRILSIPSHSVRVKSHALAEAEKILTVNLVGLKLFLGPDDVENVEDEDDAISTDNEDEDEDDDDVVINA